VLIRGVDDRLKELVRRIVEETSSELLEMEIMPDHVHLLLEVDPQFGICSLIKRIKGLSSRLLRLEFAWLRQRMPSLWTNSVFISTVGGAPLEVIKQYVRNQKNH
jgi:putative transposase